MKILITKSQYKTILEQEQKILEIPSIDYFGGWDELQAYLERKGNPPYSIGGDLNLSFSKNVTSLGSLTSVGGYLDLSYSKRLTSLGSLTSVGGYLDLSYCKHLTSLGNLTYVGDNLDLSFTKQLTSFDNLTYVGNNLDLRDSMFEKIITRREISKKIDVRGGIFI